jgi:hypothetical protein
MFFENHFISPLGKGQDPPLEQAASTLVRPWTCRVPSFHRTWMCVRLSSPGTVVHPEPVAPKPRAHRVPRSQPNPSRRFRTHNLLSSTQHSGPIPEDTFHDGCANLRAVSVAEFALVLLKHEAADARRPGPPVRPLVLYGITGLSLEQVGLGQRGSVGRTAICQPWALRGQSARW